MENLYQGDKSKLLDPRAVFIVQGPPSSPLYIWQGKDVLTGNLQKYMDAAWRHTKLLQDNEKASQEV
jgi:hypothetical protein